MRKKVEEEGKFPNEYNDKLLKVRETIANIAGKGECVFEGEGECIMKDKLSTIVPIIGNRERLGTLLLARFEKPFTDDDLVLVEYSATIVGMEILKAKQDELEEETRKKAVVQLAIGTLSYSELEAVINILGELNGNEGLLVASKIAENDNFIALLALINDDKANLVYASSKNLDVKVNDLLKDSIKLIDGNGGGTPFMAQGGGKNNGNIENTLNYALSKLEKPIG